MRWFSISWVGCWFAIHRLKEINKSLNISVFQFSFANRDLTRAKVCFIIYKAHVQKVT